MGQRDMEVKTELVLDKKNGINYYHSVENTESPSQSSPSGMPKLPVILAVIIILILAGIGGYMIFGNKSIQKQVASDTTSTVSSPSPTSGNVISSIKEALAGSQSLQCDFTDEDGRKTTSYMKSGAIRTEFIALDPKQSGSMIMKDKKIYFWNGKTGTIMTFDITTIAENITPQTPKTSPVTNTNQKPEDLVASLEKYKESCKPATVDDALFSPPADVKFTDLSAMIKTGSQTIPSGAIPSVSEEQIKALQQKYQQ